MSKARGDNLFGIIVDIHIENECIVSDYISFIIMLYYILLYIVFTIEEKKM